MRDDGHSVPILLEPQTQGDVRLHVSSRPDGEEYKVARGEFVPELWGQIGDEREVWQRSVLERLG